MIVIFVSESEDFAWRRTRRILSRYCVQIARRTWLARMSEELLEQVRGELAKASSRNMSVACHRVRGRFRTELAWVVGTRKHFSAAGEFAFSYSSNPLPAAPQQDSPTLRLCAYIVELAGLWHDMGKHSRCFQQKLRGERAPTSRDPLRHERLSLLFLFNVIFKVTNSSEFATILRCDEAVFSALKDGTKVSTAISEVWKAGTLADISTLNPKRTSAILRWFEGGEGSASPRVVAPIIGALGILILSHHWLPSCAEQDREDYLPIEHRYWGLSPEREEASSSDLELAANLKPAWENTAEFVQRSAKLADRILKLIRTDAFHFDKHMFYSAIQYIARPALILADHYVSSHGSKECSADLALCYANTNREKGMLAQPLAIHLLEVAKEAGKTIRLLPSLRAGVELPAIHEVPSGLVQDVSDTPFAWQQRGEERIRSAKINSVDGFFGVVMAATGTGKTRGNARLMAALSADQPLRFTIALGLRSLTLQTGRELVKDLNFSRSETAILVGSSLARYFFDHADSNTLRDSELKVRSGRAPGSAPADELPSEADDGAESVELFDGYIQLADTGLERDVDIHWPEILNFQSNPRWFHLQYPPVLVCTVDHLIPSVQGERSSAALAAIRLMTSDLIIDEVDSYSPKDLIPLSKLCYLAGFYGRKVIVSSATIPPAVCSALFKMYKLGLDRGAALRESPVNCFVGWFTHLADHVKVRTVSSLDDFQKEHRRFTSAFVEKLSKQPAPPRRVAVLKTVEFHTAQLAGLSERERFYRYVFDAAVTLHENHAETYKSSNILISVGCVRWSRVKSCREFASMALNAKKDDYLLKVVCYHSKHLPLALHEIETRLTILLNRKLQGSHARDQLLSPWVEEARRKGRRNLMIIVVTSPISEVGRDHDYDWGIFEPMSYWSLIQMGGRILRHRPYASISTPNILLLQTGTRAIFEPSSNVTFYQPGPESAEFHLEKTGLDGHPNVKPFCDIFRLMDIEALSERVDARYLLVEPESFAVESKGFDSFHRLEHAVLRSILSGCEYDTNSSPGLYFTGGHARRNAFRASPKRDYFFYNPEDGHWYLKDQSKRNSSVCAHTRNSSRVHETPVPLNPENSLVSIDDLDKDLLYDRFMESCSANAREQLCKPEVLLSLEPRQSADPRQTKIEYHPLLGWNEMT